jgi:uncharacterized protein with gpF-like domain
MNADKLWYAYNKFRLRKTKQFAPAIYRALQQQVKYYIATQDLVNLPQQPMQEVLNEVHKETGRQWAMQTYYGILKDAGIKHTTPLLRVKRNASFGLNEEFIQAILEFFRTDLFNTVQNITETTRREIRRIVEEGVQAQLSLDEIINNLLTSGITKNRAALISRTEVMKASNFGEQAGADRTGLATRKEWISVRDNRTRRDHITVDGSIVPDGKPFDVGGYLMQRPGDGTSEDGRKVPVREIANCRCVVGRHVLRGNNGLPLRKSYT